MKPYKGPITYLMESILMNFTLLRHIRGMDSKTIILEDMDDSQDLFIFNAITRAIRRLLRKEIYIVPVIQLRESDLIKNRLLRSLKLLEESIFFQLVGRHCCQ